MQAWLAKLPQEFQTADSLHRRRRAGDGRHRQRVVRLLSARRCSDSSSLDWDYGSYTHHTNRDSFDKIVFDDLKGNATIVAMLAYLASEDPSFITRERADRQRPVGGRRRGGGRGAQSGRAELCRSASRCRRWSRCGRRSRQHARRQGLGNDVPQGAALLQRHVTRHGAVEPPVGSCGDGADLDAAA